MGVPLTPPGRVILDVATLLADAAAAITASGVTEVGGAAAVVDFGADGVGLDTAGVGYIQATVVADVSTLNAASDQTYRLVFQLSNDADFADDATVERAQLVLGGATGFDTPAAVASAIGREYLHLDNWYNGEIYRYGRLYVAVAGTDPSITLYAFLGKVLQY